MSPQDWREALDQAAERWESGGRLEADLLHAGMNLHAALEAGPEPSPTTRRYCDACRSLAAAQRHEQVTAYSGLKKLGAYLVVALVCAIGLAGMSLRWLNDAETAQLAQKEQAGRAELARAAAERDKQAAMDAEGVARAEKAKAQVAQSEIAEEKVRSDDASRILVARLIAKKDPTTALAFLKEVKHYSKYPGWLDTAQQVLHSRPALRSIASEDIRIKQVSLSRDGRVAGTVHVDGTAAVWKLDETARPIHLLGHSAPAISVAVDATGTRVLTGSQDKTARLWSVDGKLLRTFEGHDDEVLDVAFYPNGTHVLTASAYETQIWSLADETLKATRLPGGEHSEREFARGGNFAMWDRQLQAASVVSFGNKGAAHRPIETEGAANARLSADGKAVAAWDEDGQTITMHLSTGEQRIIQADPAAGKIAHAAAPDDHTLVVVSRRENANFEEIRVAWDRLDDGKKPITLRAARHEGSVNHIWVNQDATRVYTAGKDGHVNVCELTETASGIEPRHETLAWNRPLSQVSVTDDERFVVVLSKNGRVRVWGSDWADRTMSSHIGMCDFTHASRYGTYYLLASFAGSDGVENVRLQYIAGGVEGLACPMDQIFSEAMAFSDDEDYVVLGTMKGGLAVFETSTAELVHETQPTGSMVTATAFSPSGKRVIAASDDGTVRSFKWPRTEPDTTTELRNMTANRVMVSADDRYVLATDDTGASSYSRFALIDLETGALINEQKAYATVFAADGRTLLVDRSGGVYSFDPQSNESRLLAPVTDRNATRVSLAPNGALFAVAEAGMRARVYNTASPDTPRYLPIQARRVAFAAASRNLITESYDDELAVWALTADHHPIRIPHDLEIGNVRVSEDNRELITLETDGDGTGALRIWSRDPKEVWNAIMAIASACPTANERTLLLLETEEEARAARLACLEMRGLEDQDAAAKQAGDAARGAP